MKTLHMNESFKLTFTACDGMRQFYADKMDGIGFNYKREKVDLRTDRFTIDADFNAVFIGQLADLFCSR